MPADVVAGLAAIRAELVSALVLRLAAEAGAIEQPADVVTGYWRAALDADLPREGLVGFGDLVDLVQIDDAEWLPLAAQTARRVLPARAGDNAERAAHRPDDRTAVATSSGTGGRPVRFG